MNSIFLFTYHLYDSENKSNTAVYVFLSFHVHTRRKVIFNWIHKYKYRSVPVTHLLQIGVSSKFHNLYNAGLVIYMADTDKVLAVRYI